MCRQVVHSHLVNRIKCFLFADPVIFASALEQLYGNMCFIVHLEVDST